MRQLAQVLDLKNIFWLHPPNEAKRSPWLGAQMKRLGLKAGAPDVIILQSIPKMPGKRGAMIELKRAVGGRVSKSQDDFLERAETEGWATCVAHGFKDAIVFLKDCGLI